MRVIYLKDKTPHVLGTRGDHAAACIRVEVDAWLAEYPSGHGALIFTGPEQETYPLDAMVNLYDGVHYLEAVITSTETQDAGWCVIRAAWYDGETLVYSRPFYGKIMENEVVGAEEEGAMPDWVATLIDEISDAKEVLADIDAALDAAENAEQSALDSEAWAVGKRNGEDVDEDDPAYGNNAKKYAQDAGGSAAAAGVYKQEAEAWAKGTKNGQAVPASDPAYQNNAKYWSDHAFSATPEGYEDLVDDVDDLKSAVNANITLLSWEQGTYSNGQPGASAKRIRTIVAFKTAYPFTVKAISGYGYNVFYGTTENTPNQFYNEWQTVDHTYNDTSLYYRITASHNDQSNIVPTETPVHLTVDWDYYNKAITNVDRLTFNFRWEQGNINSSGANANANNRIRTDKPFQPICPFIVKAADGYGFNVYVSDVGGTPTPLFTSWQTGPLMYTDTNKIYRFSVRKNDDSNFTPVNNAVAFDWAYQTEIEDTSNGILPLYVEDADYFIWERGTINASGGDENNTTRLRTKGTYSFTSMFKVSCDSGYGYNVFKSDVGGTPLPLFSSWQTGEMVFQIDTTKIYRFSFAKLDSSTIVVAEHGHFHLKRLDGNLLKQKDKPIMPYNAWFRTYSHSIETTKAPKNTLSACKAAYALGYRWFEADIQMTSDNVPVMCHNATINATSNYTGDKTIAEMTYDELLEYDFGSWFSPDFAGEPILTLDTLCKYAFSHDVGLSLEMKNNYSWDAETAQIVYNIVAKNHMLGRVIWNNSYTDPMTLMKQINPNQDFCFYSENNISTAWLTTAAGFLTTGNRVEVANYVGNWTAERVTEAKQAGLICQAHYIQYGITEKLTPELFKSMIDMGIESTLVQGINIAEWADEIFEPES